MPVIALAPKNKFWPLFPYPGSGKIRLYVEASIPVDVFVVNPNQINEFASFEEAQKLGIFSLPQQLKIDTVVTLPEGWRGGPGWNLVIGNRFEEPNALSIPPPSSQKYACVAAVYYMVYPA